MVIFENHSHMPENHSHKVAHTLFDFHEKWHTTLFGIYYDVEVVRIENHSLMLKIKC